MTQDYPDHTRLFHLVGTDITIPINIEASDVTLDVNLKSQSAYFYVILQASFANVYVTLVGSIITLDVNIDSQTVNIDINFADQSVAVFDAGKWFALQAKQVFVRGGVTVPDNGCALALSREVPANTTFFIIGIAYGCTAAGKPDSVAGSIYIEGTRVVRLGSFRGHGLTFDTPLRATAGEEVQSRLCQYGAGAAVDMESTIWGYDKED